MRSVLILLVLPVVGLAGGPLAPEDVSAEEGPRRPGGAVKPNRLARERSPYLRQHQTNPVDWYPWSDEALARARRQNRPIFLSVGYAACHWCHVMEHESFEDEATAALLNATFVCVKVDREERPDIDALYMRAVQVMTGRGGWPMTVVLTPEGDPFFAGTYLPRARLQELTRRIGDLWRTNAGRVRQQAEMVAERVRDLADGRELPEFEGSDADLLHVVDTALAAAFDARHGGYGGAPKFPPHTELLYLLDRARRDGKSEGMEQVRRTLDAMADGGVRDHVGGGFHRYSTDEVWLLPHFEKMLYDNALLAQAYALAFAATGERRYADVARDALGWVEREMARAGGGYASSLDADTQGEEGLTYTWTLEELSAALPPPERDLAARLFGLTSRGNFRDEASGRHTGRNVLHFPRPLATLAGELGTPPEALAARLPGLRERLRRVRDRRPQPGLDDKVITAWNGLLLSAFAHAGAALGEPAYHARGRALAEFLLASCRREDGTLLRFPRGSGPEIVGFADDHVHLAEGLLDLAETTGEEHWAAAAREIGDRLLAHFEDDRQGGFWSTSEAHHETLFARQKETFDSPIPSENGTAARLLLRLAARTGEARYRRAADRTLGAWRPLLGMARAARGTVALYRALAHRLALGGKAAAAGAAADLTVAGDLVRVDAFLERERVGPEGRTAFALRVVLAEGWHVNAARTDDPELVPTRLTAETGAPAVLERVTYPPPTRRRLGEAQPPIPLFEGAFWIRGTLARPPEAPRGPREVPLVLAFQPCSESECLAPRSVRLVLRIRFADEDGVRRHPEVFAR